MQKLSTYIITILIFLTPLLFWFLTPNFFSTPKQLLLIIGTLALFATWTITNIKNKTLYLVRSPLTLPLIFLALGFILNLILVPEARTEALIGRGSLYLSGILLTILVSIFSSNSLNKLVIKSFILSSTLLAIFGVLQLTLFYRLPSLPTFMQSRAFSPVGTPLTTLTILILGLATTISLAISTKDSLTRTLALFSTGIISIASATYLSLMLPGRELFVSNLPLLSSWSITLDALKTPQSLLTGVGLANFTPLYNSVKPLYLNNTAFWNITPNSSGSEFLQLLSTGGLLIFTPFLLVIINFLRSLKNTNSSETHSPLRTLTITSFIALVFFPISTPLAVTLFIALALASSPTPHSQSLNSQTQYILIGSSLLLVFSTLFYTGKLTIAEYHLRQASLALNNNDGQAVYTHHLQAISLAPSLTNYHLSYSQLNLSLAASLSQTNELTEDQRTQVTQLLSQSVREARQAQVLRPSLSTTSLNLANIYRQLINVADGAEDLAIQYFAQAVTLDPANPPLRVDYGGLFYQLAGSTEDQDLQLQYLNRAVQEFSTATELKPDYANAWYNLAKAYESAGNIELAYQAMQQTIASLEPGSEDVSTATTELEALKAKLPKPTEASQESNTTNQELISPSPLPSPLPGGPIDLPDNADSTTPSSTPAPSPTL